MSRRVTYGAAEMDPATQDVRHRRFWTWTENGVLFGSWTWQPGMPPATEEKVHGMPRLR